MGRKGYIKSVMISDESLGSEGELSKVGIPPPHNSDTPHALVAGNTTHTITLGKSKNKTSQAVGTIFLPKQKIKLPSFLL